MARIIYAVAGEGFGHSSRSHLIGQRFLDAGHNVMFVGSQKSLLSECLYLKKRMLLLPVAGQYEQIINARYIEKLGLGVSSEKLDETAIVRFLEELDKPAPTDERILWPDNDRFFNILQTELNKLDAPVSIEL